MPARGSRLGRFEILELLGAGGMGEVYRAHDSRLGRDVALKLVPERFLRDAQRLARFERETQVLASLNHPNIAALHEIVAIEGSHALVMELVEGETLSERIARGAMPVPEALGTAAQIATALDAAHERGIVHRDLKPGNVKLRPDGTVKLLDFGLAKVLDPATTTSDPAAATLTAAEPPGGGSVLGSPAYMSPEQARGLAVDKRGDIWAFGCVLYEMLSGTRAFGGERPSDVIAKVIEREPDFAALPADLPFTIQRLLQRCLQKDRRRRLRDIGDARHELLDALDNPGAEPTASGAFAARTSSRRRWVSRPVLLTAAVAAVLVGTVAWFAQRDRPVPQVTRFVITEPSFPDTGLAISADGKRIAYVNDSGLVVRSRDRLESTLVATRNVVQGSPFFSPDGESVGFKGWETLKTVSASGGPVATVADRQTAAEGSWAGKDIVFAAMSGLFRTPAEGGELVKLAAAGEGEQIVSVQALPARGAILYTVIPSRSYILGMPAGIASARIDALDLATGQRHVVVRGGSRPHYTRTGHLLYVKGGTLYAAAFDIGELRTRGAAVPVIVTEGLLEYDVSDEGTLVYQTATFMDDGRELTWVDRQGHATSLGAPARNYLYPRISPDGTRVAIDVVERADRDIWMWDLRRSTLERFTKDPSGNPLVTWSPDGRQLAFGSERSGVSNAYRQAADGTGEPERLLASDALQMPISYTPDGRLLLSVGVPGHQRDIYLMTLDGERKTEPLIQSPANELWAEVSPDGHWVAYDSDESGQFEVYVRPFPNAYEGSRWQVSAAGGRQPLWSPDGRELFYRDFSGALLSVPVGAGPAFAPGRPARLFEGTGYTGGGGAGGGRTYDISPDGSRFLMVRFRDRPATPLVVVLNWFEELKRLAPLR